MRVSRLLCASAFALLVGVTGFASPASATTIPILLPGSWASTEAGVGAGPAAALAAYGDPFIANEGPAPQASVYTSAGGPYGTAKSVAAVSASGQVASVSAVGQAGAVAQDIYWFEVPGPKNTKVPVTETGFVLANVQNESFGGASASAYASVVSFTYDKTTTLGRSVQFRNSLSLTTNTPYEVVLNAQVSSWDIGETAGTVATAVADPYFQIDPAFLAANPGYSLEFSPGITNQQIAAVPLPASFPLFVTGLLALMGFAAVKRVRQGC